MKDFSWESFLQMLVPEMLRVLIALIVLLVSFRIITLIHRRLNKKFAENEKLDKTVTKTLLYIGMVAFKVLIVLGLVGFLGVDTGSIAAVLASLGVGVGLAINGTLSNMAGGLMLMVVKPFKLDDYIEAGEFAGTVEDIRLTVTKLRTFDNRTVYVPNGKLASEEIINYTEKDVRRVDLVFPIAYSADFEKAKKLVSEAVSRHPLTLDEPAPLIRVMKLDSSSVNVSGYAWCKTKDYWSVKFDLTEQIKKSFDENGVQIPFNQLDVHLKNE